MEKEYGFLEVLGFCWVVLIMVCVFILGVFAGSSEAMDKSVDAGLMIQRGNVDYALGTISGKAVNEFTDGKFVLGIDYAYSEDSGEKEGEKVFVYEEYEAILKGTNIYGFLDASVEYDYAIDLDYRNLITSGMGVCFGKEHSSLKMDIGGSYFVESYDREGLADGILLRGRERFELNVHESLKVEQSFIIYPEIDNLDCFRYEAEVGIIAKIVKGLSLKVGVEDDYRSEVRSGQEKHDIITTLGVRYEF